jgi:FAD/FMN-containing dehydrogenase
VLAAHMASTCRSSRQRLAQATVGGTVAAGLAGPRAWHVVRCATTYSARGCWPGDGRVLRFGGEVMKNVAGYDVARLLAGSLGVLGVLLDVSLKVLPAAAVGGHATLFRHHTEAAEVFTPLAPPLLRLHRELKRVFDPAGILNPGRMYADL